MNRTTVDPKVMSGVPCFRGLRIPVATVVNMVAGGLSVQKIVDELPRSEADVRRALPMAPSRQGFREPANRNFAYSWGESHLVE